MLNRRHKRKLKKVLKYLVLGDVHLGHERNRTVDVIRNLDHYFGWYTDKSPFCQLDAIFIAGDLFDHLLNFSSTDVHEIQLWLSRLMRFCSRHNIVLRILEGTPSHDRKQSKVADVVYDLLKCELDFRYIDTLHVEHIESLDLNVLYVPDEWTADTELTLTQAKELIKEAGLEQVDIAIMHGAFAYQLPMAPNTVPKHNEAEYLGLVERFIHIGHVHNFSTFDRIIAEGSFDRLAHGEEEAKGAVVATLSPDGDSFDFIENKEARIFKTIELKSKDLEKSMAEIKKILAKIPENSFVRIKSTKDHPVYQAFDELKSFWPMYTFSKSTTEDDQDSYQLINNAVELDREFTPIHIHRDNIVSLLTQAVLSKHSLNPRQREILNNTLESTNAA